jgi:alpha-L-rhamnosidase
VACGWSITGDLITVTATVPPGSTAVLEVPTSDPDGVLVDGRPSHTGATPRLASGHHVVTAPFSRETT